MQGLIEIYFGNHVSEIGFFVMFSKTKDYKFLFFLHEYGCPKSGKHGVRK